MPDAMETEFDDLAGWTEETLEHLSFEDAIAAACRGSGNPVALTWLAKHMQINEDTTFLDVGGGLGGPAAWLRDRYGPQVVVVEPMPRAASGTHRLWNIPSAVAWAEHLPFSVATFDAAWALGVLDTTPQKAELLAELRRVVRPTGHVGLLAYERTTNEVDHRAFPDGNQFPNAEEMQALLAATGWAIANRVDVSTLPPPPLSWNTSADHAEDRVAANHDQDKAMNEIRNQEHHMRTLLEQRIIIARLYDLIRTSVSEVPGR